MTTVDGLGLDSVDLAPEGHVEERRAARNARLLDGVATLRTRVTSTAVDGERLLFILGAVLVPFGFLLIMLGYLGASDTGLVFEQMPYLISGGLAGLGLMITGGFLYFAWWMTRLVRENREQNLQLIAHASDLVAAQAELVAAIEAMRTDLAGRENGAAAAPARRPRLRADQ